MWVFTPSGFVSIVAHRDLRRAVMVRARDERSLRPLADLTGSEIQRTPVADYPYRLVCRRDQVQEWLARQVQTMEYDNFKNEVAAHRGHDFADVLLDVWSTMHDVEDAEARNR